MTMMGNVFNSYGQKGDSLTERFFCTIRCACRDETGIYWRSISR